MLHNFDVDECLHTIQHYLPAQSTLKDFVHHNSLHSFQDKEFFEGIFSSAKIFGFQVTFNVNEYRKLHRQGRIKLDVIERVIKWRKGKENINSYTYKMLDKAYSHDFNPRVGQLREQWKSHYKIDINNLVQPLFFRILGSYLDQGISLWSFPFEDKGLLNAIKTLEENSFSSFFTSKRVKELLFSEELTIEYLLNILVGDNAFYTNYLFDQQYSHKGWSGIVGSIEENSASIFYKKNISFKEVVLLELLLEIDALDNEFGKKWKPLASHITEEPIDYLSKVPIGELQEILQLWQEAFEWDYYDEVLSAVGHLAKTNRLIKADSKSFQAMFCIDDRECSIRRHLETTDPNCETLGAPGFFGAAIYFQPFAAKFYDKNCPVAITPKHLIKEIESSKSKYQATNSVIASIMQALSLGIVAGFRMILDLVNPKMREDISDAFEHMDINGKLLIEASESPVVEGGLQLGYKVEEMVDIVESLLRGIGLVDNFSSLVYVVAHGSSSANNPHHGAHDCGACSGRPGAVNARVFAFMANHPQVRTALKERGLDIPSSTQFVGAMHDTASDEIEYYDLDILSPENANSHLINDHIFEESLDLNAKERARRFASINIKRDIKHIRNEIKKRSVSYFEPRPELGHGTNALCHVGSREKMKGLFLDRRAFLQSYDYRTDPDGELLKQVMAPLPAVCGGINLEYYFSRMDIEKMGAGTKLPHNVTGLIGVTNSSDGDLRTGLPLQMIENHDPVRLLMMVEHTPEIVLKVIKANQDMYDWFDKGWLHLVAISPEDGNLYYFMDGAFVLYNPLKNILKTKDVDKLIQDGEEMTTNHILDATKENIPVHVYHSKEEK